MLSEVTDSIFVSGSLLMPTAPTGNTLEEAVRWSDSIVISSLIVACTILFIINLRNFIIVLPSLFESFIRRKGCVNLEGKMVLVRARTIIGLTLILPFSMIACRFNLLPLEILDKFTPNIVLAAYVAIFMAYICLRWILNWQLEPKNRAKEAWNIGHGSAISYFIIMTMLMLIDICILTLFGIEDTIIRKSLYYIMGTIYTLAVLRRLQILRVSCNSFTIILYLCALEIFPLGILVAAARFL